MISRKRINDEKESLEGLGNLVELYEEISASRMQKVRGAVLQSRLFMEGLIEVFDQVRRAYVNKSEHPLISKRLNGRTVAVLVSANAGLYGEIVEKTFERFADFVRKNKPDVVVLGKQGVASMAEKLPQVLYNYFDFSDEQVDGASLGLVMRYLLQFEKIVVFHGQFKSILYQEPHVTVVTGEAPATSGPAPVGKFLFEPSIEQIAEVFEGEIMASIFEQSLHEGMLAKFASRLIGLDRALENIHSRKDEVRREERKLLHKLRNRKQLNTMSGIGLWV